MQPRKPGVESLDHENHEQGDYFGGRLVCFEMLDLTQNRVPTAIDTCRQINRQVSVFTDKYREVPTGLDYER
jgi:hypothetical protein